VAQIINDPGFGLKADRLSGRILKEDGSINVDRRGQRFHITDVYHYLLVMSWTKFLSLTVAFYILVNFIFGFIYLLIGTDQILNAHTDGWWVKFSDAMFFSSQTLTTVGYGNLAPGSALVSAISSLEALTGLFLFGIFTGLSFGRFSRVKPRITFAHEAVFAPFRENQNAFMFRIVNERSSIVMDMSATVLVVMQDLESSIAERRYYALPLQIAQIRSLAMNWTVVHPIDSESPLFKLGERDLVERNAEFLIILSAFDDTVGQKFYSRHSYRPHEIRYGAKYSKMYWTSDQGDVELHINKVHDTEPAELYP